MEKQLFVKDPNFKNPTVDEATSIVRCAIDKEIDVFCVRQIRSTQEIVYKKFSPSQFDENNFFEEARSMMETIVANEDTHVIVSLNLSS